MAIIAFIRVTKIDNKKNGVPKTDAYKESVHARPLPWKTAWSRSTWFRKRNHLSIPLKYAD